MAFGTRVFYEALRSVAFGSVGASYAALGVPLTGHARLFSLKNATDVALLISLDGSTDHIYMGANSYMIVDMSANKVRDDGLFLAVGTQFYVKHDGSSPTEGSIYLEIINAEGGT